MTKAMYVGSFDPVTKGHLNIINRSAKLFDEMVIVVSASTAKKYVFSLQERVAMIKKAIHHLGLANVSVIEHDGLTIRLAENLDVDVLVRGIRSVKDMEYETDIANLNKTQNPSIETVFLMSDPNHRAISSTMVKEIAHYDGNTSELVPEYVQDELRRVVKKGR